MTRGRKPRGESPSVVVTLRMTAEELAVVDAARGDMPRSVWLRERILRRLGDE